MLPSVTRCENHQHKNHRKNDKINRMHTIVLSMSHKQQPDMIDDKGHTHATPVCKNTTPTAALPLFISRRTALIAATHGV